MNSDTDRKTDKNTAVLFLKDLVQEFVDNRDWRKFHSPKNLSMSISIEAAELMELFQWLTVEESVKASKKPVVLDKIREEIADVMIYCFNFANVTGIDLTTCIIEKITRNEQKYPITKYKGRF
ncbi:MAG: nucleotide pyrophosphohydrolase [Candidatus Hodarchaeales archaeon]